MTTLIFDTETTGLPRHPAAKDAVQPRIIEFGAVLTDDQGNIIDEIDVLINPGMPLPEEIVKITGITDAELADAPRFPEVAERLRSFFRRAGAMIAHNLPFDRTLVAMELERHGLSEGWPWPPVGVCTVQEHAEEWGRRPRLLELYEHYMGAPLAQKHRALDDVKALRDVCVAAGVLSCLSRN